jgi:type I restriction-modification system DNA methylase subunit
MAPDVPHDNLSNVLIEAMEAIEEAFEPLTGVLPKEFGIFERVVLEDLLRIFNREALKKPQPDIFDRIYEYFLMNFALQGTQDNGEFFTPPSLVQTIAFRKWVNKRQKRRCSSGRRKLALPCYCCPRALLPCNLAGGVVDCFFPNYT